MEYLVHVHTLMRVWEMVGNEPEERDPLSPGKYWFLRINSPVPGSFGDWIVLKHEHEIGRMIGRHVTSISDKFSQEEGFVIEIVIRARQGSKSPQEKQLVR